MSIVDTFGWDKLDVSEYDKRTEVDVNENLQMALLSFENDFGIRPNRIVMGYVLVRKLLDMFYSNTPYKEDEVVKYCDIPVSVDYENPNKLEVGYMVNHTLKVQF